MKRRGAGVVMAAFACLLAVRPVWADAEFSEGQSLDVKALMTEARAKKVPEASPVILAGQTVEWVAIPGGKFKLGTPDFNDAGPIREIDIATFEMSKTLVTVAQYAECMIKGKCTEPGRDTYCNWGQPGRQLHPVNCVDWDQANQYAKFMGARLPSESEWEYAATSGGKKRKYPWGDDAATCGKAVMYGSGGNGCGSESTMPVCSKPAGNTAQGLCDMAGNVWQWVQDKFQLSYADTPADGGAFEAAGSSRVVRGGGFSSSDPELLRAGRRGTADPGYPYALIGFRLARPISRG